MSTIENVWPADACDGISLWTPGGDVTVIAAGDNQIRLESEREDDSPHPDGMKIVGRWLLIRLFGRHPDDGQFTLYLPEKRAWAVQLAVGHGDVKVSNIQARLRVDVQRGDIQVENCRGVFAVSSGQGDVKLQHCTEANVPEPPPQPEGSINFRVPPFPEGPLTINPGPSRPWRWEEAEDWATWGMDVANQARNWAQQFRQLFGPDGWGTQKGGIGLHVGRGDARLESDEANECNVRVGSGDTTIEGGWLASLQVKTGGGDIECESAMPVKLWLVETAHGDINLSLPANAQVRLDVATRHGDISSAVPLVRVGRPGPESRYGGRMVGTLGTGDGQPAEISLVSMHGDIEINLDRTPSPYTGKHDAQDATTEAAATPGATANVITTDSGQQDVAPTANAGQPEYSTEMAILQSLSEGKITAAEAEQLLRNLGA